MLPNPPKKITWDVSLVLLLTSLLLQCVIQYYREPIDPNIFDLGDLATYTMLVISSVLLLLASKVKGL